MSPGMLGQSGPALVVLLVALSGCVSPVAPGDPTPKQGTSVDESLPAAPALFQFGPGADGLHVAASVWHPPAGAQTAVLGIHGSGGSKDGYGPIPIPSYSFAHAVVGEGRAFVAIDLPGYGESPSSTPQTMEDMALIVNRVADALRSGAYELDGGDGQAYEVVVGLGISMGGLLVQMAQGQYGSFDGIVSGSWSYGGFSNEYQACSWRGQGCPENMLETLFYVPNVAEEVLAWLNESGGGPRPLGNIGAMSITSWTGCTVVPSPPPRIGTCERTAAHEARVESVTSAIEVPVLLIFGDKDYYWETGAMEQEASRFTNAPDVDELTLPDTEHLFMWHLTKPQLHRAQNAWLDEHDF